MGKQLIPFRDRLVLKRVKHFEISKDSPIVMPDTVKDNLTSYAIVRHVPDSTFADELLIKNAERIVDFHVEKAKDGDSGALNALKDFNDYIKLKSIKVGDMVLISKYAGLVIQESNSDEEVVVVNAEDVMGVVR